MGIFSRFLGHDTQSRGVTVSPQLLSLLQRQTQTAAGIPVTPETALQAIAVYSAVKVLAETIAALPLFVYSRLQDGGKQIATDHYLYTLLHSLPNKWTTSFEFRETMMAHLCLYGNAYAEIERDRGGRPIALWILRPDKMRVTIQGGELKYLYRMPNGKEQPLFPPDVLHVRNTSTDRLVGLSPIAIARQSIGLNLAAESFGARFFANDARPGILLKHPKALSDTAYERLKKEWEDRHGGVSNAHRIAILEEGLGIEEVGIPPEDAQFLQTRKYQTLDIARLYRVPPHLMADLERSTLSNVEQQAIDFVVHTVTPWAVRWEQAISRDLVTESDRPRIFAEFQLNGLLRGDIAARFTAYNTGRNMGVLSANEIRRLENMNPIPNGDTYWTPLNVTASRQSDPPQSRPAPERALVNGEKRAISAARRRSELQKDQIPVYEDVIARIIRREANDIGTEARKQLSRRDMQVFSDWLGRFYNDHIDFVKRNMTAPMTAYMRNISRNAAEEVEAEAPDVDDFIRSYIGTYAVRHISRQEARVRQVLEANLSDPLPALDDLFQEWRDGTPAGEMAADESVRGNNAIAKISYIASGITLIRWVTIGKNCPYCRQLSGRVIGVNQQFIPAGGGIEADGVPPLTVSRKVGHPPAHRGCDCMIVASR